MKITIEEQRQKTFEDLRAHDYFLLDPEFPYVYCKIDPLTAMRISPGGFGIFPFDPGKKVIKVKILEIILERDNS